MKPWRKIFILGTTLMLAASLISPAQAAKKRSSKAAAAPGTGDNAKISSDPGAPTVKENKLLKWVEVDPPNIGKNDQFFFRGVVLDVVPLKDAEGKDVKDAYTIKVLPISILENNERSIDLQEFLNGVDIVRSIPDKKWMKDIKKGNVIEIKQWYETVDQGGQGHAKMVGYIFHQDIVPYPVGSQAFIKTPGLQMEQYLNALKGLEMAEDKNTDDLLKDSLDALASSATNPEVKSKAAALLSQLFNAQPTGKPLPPVPPPAGTEPAEPAGKKKKG